MSRIHRAARTRCPSAETAIAIVWLLVGLQFFLDPSSAARTPVGRALPPFVYVWNAFYVLGGMLLLAGRRSHRLLGGEELGVALLGGGFLINAIAIAYTHSLDVRALAYFYLSAWAVGHGQRLPR